MSSGGGPDGHDRAAGGALDFLAAAALPVENPWLPGWGSLQAVGNLARRPGAVASRAGAAAAGLARIVRGSSEVRPADDVRFRDAAWTTNPIFRALAQAYLVVREAGDELIDDAELDWRTERRLRLAFQNVADALAPTNLPVTNPTALKAVIDTGGRNLLEGGGRLVSDARRGSLSGPSLPRAVETSAFTVGRTLAATPGSVVLREPQFELIQYRPTTPQVRERPLLMVPSVVNKYYVIDLAPGRSLVEHARDAGSEVFAISWRNPGPTESGWSLDSYAAAVLEAVEAVRAIAGADAAHVLGLCAGGIVLTAGLGVLAVRGELDGIASLTLAVSALDNERLGSIGAMIDHRTAALAIAESARLGYVEGRSLAGVFAWMRPHERIWHHWVNSYLLARPPSPFDIVFWAEDHVNLSAAMHRDLVELTLANSLAQPGALTVLGAPLDLRRVDLDAYLVAGLRDHITPWEHCYRSGLLLGSRPRFALSSAGHIATVVNPPDRRGAHWAGELDAGEADAWLQATPRRPGSWWPDWTEWLTARSGELKPARRRLGDADHRPLERAPGTYVL